MRPLLGILFVAATLATPLRSTARSNAAPRAAGFIRGVALGHYTDINPKKLERKLKQVKAVGASHVSLVVQWSTRDVRSTQLAPREQHTTSDKKLELMIARTRAHGMKVVLFPIVDVQIRKPLEWRGVIKPPSWEAWWRSYRRFILHYARIAAQTKVAVFCVGSELVTTEKMRKRWAALIAAVKKVYRGKLLYSANWDHYDPVTFWDLVDYIGLTSYYTLAKRKDADEETMLRSWKGIRDKLVAWARKKKRQLLFTEVGYPSLDGGAVHPWDYTQGTPVDLEEQRRAYRAFVRAWSGVKELSGVVFWDWYGEGGPKDKRYTPYGKPAEQVIKRWFTTGRF
ncbi:MAG: hypothetical protein CSA24_01375 [Deltaproteobacteria bacterium]|nr:MAG: hypothetical protein CSB49_06930 [Pseudomonadota bacterium]PIE65953.1 MAG: hypothetical protein CSA24_01375 [Deltaproteobacteria bacterium]